MTTTYLLKGTHKTHGWTRELILKDGYGSGQFRIVPTDDSGPRIVALMSAGSWQNHPQDDRAKVNEDRVVLLEGQPLPDWAADWLHKVNAKSCGRAREAFQAAMDDAGDCFRDTGW
jgi:hypothetical protein